MQSAYEKARPLTLVHLSIAWKMVDRARYVFKLSAWNELAGVDDFFTLFYFVRNDGKTDIEIIGWQLLVNAPTLIFFRHSPLMSECALAENKHRRKFLARMPYPALKLEDVRPGAR